MKVIRKIIHIDEDLCTGCGDCVPACAEGALEIVEGKARVIADIYCDGLGACLGECPAGALHIEEREAEEFDEQAVETLLEEKHKSGAESKVLPMAAGGCPSARMVQSLESDTGSGPAPQDAGSPAQSALGHWPVQIMLVPPTAPFLKSADLLVLADCVPVAFPTLHRDFLQGRAVLMGCPKLDNTAAYVEKFAQIFQQSEPRRVTSVVMEVPCCSALPAIVKKAMERSGVVIPMEEVVISVRGKILEHRRVQAA